MFDRKIYYREYGSEWYKENKSLTKARVFARRKKLRAEKQKKILEYLAEHPCVDCGETDVIVLQFDHVRGKKKYALSNIISGGHSWFTVLNEIEKCEVRCANCHLRKTVKEHPNYKVPGLSANA